VLTGGQTGVDTAAAMLALRAGLAVQVVFPRGMLQEDGPITPSRRRAFRGAVLHELSSDSFRYRTWTCTYLADAVILLDPAGGAGCSETIRAARTLGRPMLVLGHGEDPVAGPADPLGDVSFKHTIEEFLSINGPQVLMIAGCRGSLLATAHKTRWVRAPLGRIISSVAGHETARG